MRLHETEIFTVHCNIILHPLSKGAATHEQLVKTVRFTSVCSWAYNRLSQSSSV